LYSLQASLDILRKHRPDYTPRTGFVWPIADSAAPEDDTKKKGTSEEATDLGTEEAASKHKEADKGDKKQQNYALLMNAMRATAIHSAQPASTLTAPILGEASAAETPVGGVRSSATPAPQQESAAKPSPASVTVPPPQTATKAPAGAGKKKRKSACSD